jgi:hypothetical protein
LRGDNYKEVYLESTSHPLAITPKAFDQIAAIVKAHLICTFCYKRHMPDNPQVAENVCLGCFKKHRTNRPTDLIFVEEVPSEYAERYGYKVYKFVDPEGYVYITNSHNKLNDRLERDIQATLLHYGYQIPERYTTKSGKEVELTSFSWQSIYGDFHTSPVVIATYHEYYGDHIETAFLLYKDRDPVEFSKTKNPVRQWYREAKAEIEATYQPHRGYIVSSGENGERETAYQLYDSHVYPGIVARACSAYEQSLPTHHNEGAQPC